MPGPVVEMTPKVYLLFWLIVMGVCTGVGGVIIWRLNILISLLTELLKK